LEDWEGCSTAITYSECLNVEPFRSNCAWGGQLVRCKDKENKGVNIGVSSKSCDQIVSVAKRKM